MQSQPASLTASARAQPETVALFVSDIHLQSGLPHTTQAFFDFLRAPAMQTRALYLLGDLFEYWAGDDDLADEYNMSVAQRIRAVSDAGVAVYWIGGNRDFLIGDAFAQAAGLQLLPDPSVVSVANRRVTITHGDAQCTDDTGYMKFREEVRHPDWQQRFLSMPLAQRKAIIAGMRSGSREAQRTKAYEIMDVNPSAIDALFTGTGSDVLIHGHTHRPARHVDAGGRERYVLPDWDCDAAVRRGGWIGINDAGGILRYDIDGRAVD